MKSISLIIALNGLLLLTGCATQNQTSQRVGLDSLGTGIGGSAAYFGSNGNPAITTAGAVTGFALSEALQSIARTGREKAYSAGMEEGKAIGQEQILQGLWDQSNGLNKAVLPGTSLLIPSRQQNGVLYDKHFLNLNALPLEKFKIPTLLSSNAVYESHYETIQPERFK